MLEGLELIIFHWFLISLAASSMAFPIRLLGRFE